MESKKIYIIQMHTNTIPSKVVKQVTRYKYSHVAISLTKACDTIYSFGRKKLSNIICGGFVTENRNGAFFKKFSNTMCKIYEIEVTDKQYEYIENVITTMKENSNSYKYDFIGLIIRLFKIPICFKNKYVCSYFVADLLEKAGVYNFSKKSCYVVPKDFEKLESAELLYEGKYLANNLC